MNQRVILALLVSVCIFVSAVAQTKPAAQRADDKDDVVKITTNLVQIDAVVTKDRRPVTNLTAEDFEIYQDGKRQTITSFAYISNIAASPSAAPDKGAPEKVDSNIPPAGPIKRDVARRTIAIVVDDMGMSVPSLNDARRQLKYFIAEQIQPNDLVAIIRTGGEMGALQQFTNDKRMLNRAVDLLRWNPCSRLGLTTLSRVEDLRGGGCYGYTPQATLKKLRFILNAMGELPGRKSMILMSDDIPERVVGDAASSSSAVTVGGGITDASYGGWLQRITEEAIRSSVVIYSVDTQGLQYTGITAGDAVAGSIPERKPALVTLLDTRFRILQARKEGALKIARQTGGFQVSNSNGFQLDRILEDQSGYYLIGYRPSEETFNRKFHHITAKVKGSGMTVRTRTGFFGVTEEDARSRPSVETQTNLALISPFGAQALELELSSFFTRAPEGSVVRSFVYLNPQNLTFTTVNDRQQTSLEIHGAIFGENGTVEAQVKRGAVLNLRQNEYEQALRDGLNLRLDIPAKEPGSYQVRVAVRDEKSAKIGSAGEFVTVPDLKKHLATSGVVLRGIAETAPPAVAMANPGTRHFRPGSDLHFAFLIYNAALNPATQLPNLVLQARLFRDGKPVGTGMETAVSVGKQADLARLFTTGSVKLDRNLEPGDYFLQVVVTDNVSRAKAPSSTQWIGFEIVK
jgi:VWFA-related protein